MRGAGATGLSRRASACQTWLMTATLEDLAAAVAELPTAEEVEIVDDTFVAAYIDFAAVGSTVGLNVDPDFDEQEGEEDVVNVEALIATTKRLLAVSAEHWQTIVDEVVEEIEAAVGDEEVEEKTPLADDIELASLAVFTDAVLVGFVAHQQFPDSMIYVQLDEDFEVEDIAIESDEDDADEE